MSDDTTERASEMERATEAGDVGFAEFTAELINSVFDAVIASDIEQIDSYLKLVKTLTKELSSYISETEGEVSNADILAYLDKVPALATAFADDGRALSEEDLNGEDDLNILPDAYEEANGMLNISALSDGVVDVLGAVGSKTAAGVYAMEAGPLVERPKDPVAVSRGKLLDAIAQKISADKYSMLQEMTRLGMTRLVVENGLIETKLLFETMNKQSHRSQKSDKQSERKTNVAVQRGRLTDGNELFRRGRGRTKNKERYINVRTSKETDINKSSTTTSIFSRVVINFRTDYLPLTEA